MKNHKLINYIINTTSFLATISVFIITILALHAIQPAYQNDSKQVLGESISNVLEIIDLQPKNAIIKQTSIQMQNGNNYTYTLDLSKFVAANYYFKIFTIKNQTDKDYTVYVSAQTEPPLSSLKIDVATQGVTLPLIDNNNLLSAEVIVPKGSSINFALKISSKNDINVDSKLIININSIANE